MRVVAVSVGAVRNVVELRRSVGWAVVVNTRVDVVDARSAVWLGCCADKRRVTDDDRRDDDARDVVVVEPRRLSTADERRRAVGLSDVPTDRRGAETEV